MRLGTLLLRDAVITLTQLEQSLRAQILSGGRLGTNLVELGFVDLNTLGRYIARSMVLPLAIESRLEKADKSLIELFGAELADQYSAIPLGPSRDDPKTVDVVMANPHDKRGISAIEKVLRLAVQPYVTAELRLYYYLERYYGIKRRARFLRSGRGDTGSATQKPKRERRATQPFRGMCAPVPVSIAPCKNRETERQDRDGLRDPVLSYKDAQLVIQEAAKREEIATALMQFSIGRFECAALFSIRDRNAIGWIGEAEGLGEGSLERLSIPLGGTSIFQAAHDSGVPSRGGPISAGHPHERELWKHFALKHEPSDLHVVPIVLDETVVHLLYAHSYPEKAASEESSEQLVSLAKHASRAYGRIIQSTQSEPQDRSMDARSGPFVE